MSFINKHLGKRRVANDSPYSEAQKSQMLALARKSIQHGLAHGKPLTVPSNTDQDPLQATRCCFVTLHKQGDLRGCIGALSAERPLMEDIASHAYAAAFEDPRFPALQAQELDQVTISLSILSPIKELRFDTEKELLAQLKPFHDGVILEDGSRRATFLPAVWEQLPEKTDFWQQLKRKARLEADYWSPTLRVFCYTTESFGEAD